MTKETMISRVNVVDHSVASILILEAMVATVGDRGEIVKHFDCNAAGVEVQMLVNGQPVDAVKALTDAWERLESGFEERAKEKAMEMIQGAGLRSLLDAIEQAEWQIRDKLEAVCPKR